MVIPHFDETWRPAPQPWVKRRTAASSKPRYRRSSPTGSRVWHMAIGLRKDSGIAQTYCNVGSGPGPFLWREAPVLDWREEPREQFCRRCTAYWTETVTMATVRVEGVRATKAALKALIDEMSATDFAIVKPIAIEDAPATLAEVHHDDGKAAGSVVKYLLTPTSIVRIG